MCESEGEKCKLWRILNMFYILFQAEEAGDVNILSNHNMAMDIVVR